MSKIYTIIIVGHIAMERQFGTKNFAIIEILTEHFVHHKGELIHHHLLLLDSLRSYENPSNWFYHSRMQKNKKINNLILKYLMDILRKINIQNIQEMSSRS